jgi:hypothetical protein
MSASRSIDGLFPEAPLQGRNVTGIFDELGRYGIRNLAYYGDPGCNPGYIFRGETDFDCPLQSSIERECYPESPAGSGSLTENALNATELRSLARFLEERGPNLARMIDTTSNVRSSDDVWWWLSLKQHYDRGTRMIDFTRDIRIALYFAVEQHFRRHDRSGELLDLIIYCLPCRDLRHPHDPDSNKCSYQPTEKLASVDMNLAIGREIGLPWMERHKGWFPDAEPEKYYSRKPQRWGWDRPFYENPRLRFQKGMFVYPYDYPSQPLEKKSDESWFVQNLRQSSSSLEVSADLPPKRIRIPAKHADSLKLHLKDRYHLTRGTVYLDPTAAD